MDDSKIIRLGRVDHVTSEEDDRIPKKVLIGTFHNTRPVGKPRTRWEDVVPRDTSKILLIRGCSRRAEDRGEQRRLMRGSGLWRHIWKWTELKTTMIAVQLTFQFRIETSTFKKNNFIQKEKAAQLGGNRYSSNRWSEITCRSLPELFELLRLDKLDKVQSVCCWSCNKLYVNFQVFRNWYCD